MKYFPKSYLFLLLAAYLISFSSCSGLSKNYYSTKRFPHVMENDRNTSTQYYQKVTKVVGTFDLIEIDLSFDEPECHMISYQIWNSDIVGDDYIPYRHKMLILEHKSPDRDTSNVDANKKETFSFIKKGNGYEYKSDMKMLTVPQIQATIQATKNKLTLNRYNLYEFLGKTDTITYISTHPKNKEIELIESLINQYCIEATDNI